MDEKQTQPMDKEQSQAETPPDEPTRENSAAASSAPLPEACFESLVTLLASQAMASMGKVPGSDDEQSPNKPLARHYIDILSLLEEKTRGNLTDFESEMLTQTLHTLRMMYIHTS